MKVVAFVLPGYEASNAKGWHHNRRSRVDLTTLLLLPPPMGSDSPDTDQVVRAASRRVHRTKPGNPANDPVALALLSHLSRDDGSTNAWARPPHAAPALVFVDRHGPGPKTTPGDRHNVRGATPRHTPSQPCCHTTPPTSAHKKPWRLSPTLVPSRQAPRLPASSRIRPPRPRLPPGRSPGPATTLNP